MPPVAEVLFLNYTNPSNDDSACQIRHAAMSSVLGMLGLTPNFIEELKLPEKRAIIFLASYAVDWRSCPQEYDDITICFSRKSRREKVMISGLDDVNREPLDYARHILFTRIQPNIRALRRQSHQINISISTVAPLGVAAPQPADPPPNNTVATVSGNSPSAANAPPLSGQASLVAGGSQASAPNVSPAGHAQPATPPEAAVITISETPDANQPGGGQSSVVYVDAVTQTIDLENIVNSPNNARVVICMGTRNVAIRRSAAGSSRAGRDNSQGVGEEEPDVDVEEDDGRMGAPTARQNKKRKRNP